MKEFSLDGDPHGAPTFDALPQEILDSIYFDRLESFSVQTWNPNKLDFLIDMIVKNTELRTVSIDCVFTFEELSKLIGMLPQLKELTIIWQSESSGAELHLFLEWVIASNRGLETLTVDVAKYVQLTYLDLVEFVPHGWIYSKGACYQNPGMLQLTRSN